MANGYSSTFQGMDVLNARIGARRMGGHTSRLRSITGTVTNLLADLEWEGEDARAFFQAWSSFSPQVMGEVESATTRSVELTRRADLQWDCSRG